MAVKLTVNLPDSTYETIRRIADENGISRTEALRQIIDNQGFLQEQVKKGSKLLLEKDKALQQVILSTAKQ